MKVKEVAELVGISVRTLHHYDEIGLLTPEKTSESGYRLYSEEDLEKLQQILFFKELGFPLKEIKEIIHNPAFDRMEALELQQGMLLEKRKRLDQMIMTVEKTIRHMKGEIQMSTKEKFEGFDFRHNPYEQEARERWGDEAVNKANNALNKLSADEQKAFSEEIEAIYHRLASLRHLPPESEEAQAGIEAWYHFLNNNYGQTYSLAAFKGLGELYVADERFTKNIDRFAEGLAEFMCKAMAVFADRHQT